MNVKRKLPPYSKCRRLWWLFSAAMVVVAAALMITAVKWAYFLAPDQTPEAIINPEVRGLIERIIQIPLFPRPVLPLVPPYSYPLKGWLNILSTAVLVIGFLWLTSQQHHARDCLRRHRDAKSRDLDRQADEHRR